MPTIAQYNKNILNQIGDHPVVQHDLFRLAVPYIFDIPGFQASEEDFINTEKEINQKSLSEPFSYKDGHSVKALIEGIVTAARVVINELELEDLQMHLATIENASDVSLGSLCNSDDFTSLVYDIGVELKTGKYAFWDRPAYVTGIPQDMSQTPNLKCLKPAFAEVFVNAVKEQLTVRIAERNMEIPEAPTNYEPTIEPEVTADDMPLDVDSIEDPSIEETYEGAYTEEENIELLNQELDGDKIIEITDVSTEEPVIDDVSEDLPTNAPDTFINKEPEINSPLNFGDDGEPDSSLAADTDESRNEVTDDEPSMEIDEEAVENASNTKGTPFINEEVHESEPLDVNAAIQAKLDEFENRTNNHVGVNIPDFVADKGSAQKSNFKFDAPDIAESIPTVQDNISVESLKPVKIAEAVAVPDNAVIDMLSGFSRDNAINAIDKHPAALRWMKQNTRTCMDAVRQNGLALEYVKKPNFFIERAAVKENGLAIQFVKHQTRALQVEAIKENPFALYSIKSPSPAAVLLAINKNYESYTYNQIPGLPDENKLPCDPNFVQGICSKFRSSLNQHICNVLVKTDPMNLRFIPSEFKTARLCKSAVAKAPHTIQFVPQNRQTDKLLEMAIDSNPNVIAYMPNPSIELCAKALELDRNAFKYIPQSIKEQFTQDFGLEEHAQTAKDGDVR